MQFILVSSWVNSTAISHINNAGRKWLTPDNRLLDQWCKFWVDWKCRTSHRWISKVAGSEVSVHPLRAGCSKPEPKISAPPQTTSRGGGGAVRPKCNQLEMVTTFTYKPSLVKIDARNFGLSWKQTLKHTTPARPLQIDRTGNNTLCR